VTSAPAERSRALRVDWLELFFDLVFVIIIARLTDLIHGDPGPAQFVQVVALFAIVWISWLGATTFVNLSGGYTARTRIPMFVAVAGAAMVAAAIPEATTTGSLLFVSGLALARLALWLLWLDSRRTGRLRATLYGPGSAAVWIATAALPEALRLPTWILIGGFELISGARGFGRNRFDVPHLLERVGLFVMIVLGESLVEVVVEIHAAQSATAWVVSAAAFVLCGLLAWQYFQDGAPLGSQALTSRSGRSLRDVIVIAHFLLVLGLIGVAAGLGSAIERADGAGLPVGATIALGAGIGVYHFANVLIAWRYGVRSINLIVLASVAASVLAVVSIFGSRWPTWAPVVLVVLYLALEQTVLPWLFRQQADRILRTDPAETSRT
jgi:low temperature requirement protein LtrA